MKTGDNIVSHMTGYPDRAIDDKQKCLHMYGGYKKLYGTSDTIMCMYVYDYKNDSPK